LFKIIIADMLIGQIEQCWPASLLFPWNIDQQLVSHSRDQGVHQDREKIPWAFAGHPEKIYKDPMYLWPGDPSLGHFKPSGAPNFSKGSFSFALKFFKWNVYYFRVTKFLVIKNCFTSLICFEVLSFTLDVFIQHKIIFKQANPK